MRTPGDVFEEVSALESAGLLLAAHDVARAALDAGMDDDRLRHRALLALARSGATGVALDLFRAWGLDRSADPEIGGLGARLLKDLALHAGDPAAALAAEAAYSALWRRTGEAWLGVNAAAMALLAGDAPRAAALAAAIGTVRDTGDYWSAVTAAEAAVLQGDTETAARWLAEADDRADADLTKRATTRRQLRWECARLRLPSRLADLLRIPEVLTYCGHIPTGPADEQGLVASVEGTVGDAGFGYGGLAAGADIVIAEALLRRGVQLHAFLPCPPDAFEALSVAPAGGDWVPRFRACLARARVAVLEPVVHDDWSFTLASRRAMGLARMQARALETGVRQIAVWDGRAPRAAAGTAVDIAAWRAAGLPVKVLASPWPPRPRVAGRVAGPVRRLRAVLFGDLPGFGRLDDTALAAFYATGLGAIAEVVDRERPDYRNAWGDAVQCVFAHPNAAARCALGISAALTPDRLAAMGLPTFLTPRLALDHGALLPVHDSVQRADKYAGTTMTRAARIEPVTPPGRIYATEAFACEMALEPFPAVTCDYAGYTRTAKDYGVLPLYLVRPAPRPSSVGRQTTEMGNG